MLADLRPIGFVPVRDLDVALPFFRDVLGLELVTNDGFALVFTSGGQMIRVVAVGELTPQPFTVAGWEAPEIAATVAALEQRGLTFLRFEGMGQDEHGIWTAPGGDQVAWFNDPDGNVLSLSSHGHG